nr:MerR family transcriptional regulator [uncultured Duganella sp.]
MNEHRNQAVLKVGELAARSGLTVRALHHYDSIGLLTPSAHTDSGYRLYNRADVARLHQIQALRRFGMSLADIGTFLASPEAPFADVVAQQIATLDQQIAQASALREQLSHLHRQMAGGGEPELADWLSTLELMNLYDKYFTKDELHRLPFWQQDARRNSGWAALVAQIQDLMRQGVLATNAEPRQLAERWMQMLERDTAANPDFARRITVMMEMEPAAQLHTGITPQLKQYVIEAFGEHKLALYADYLDEDELRRMRVGASQHGAEWMALIAAVHRQLDAGADPAAPASQALAREWMTLFSARFGDNPATLEKIRHAHTREPRLLVGTWVTPAMLDFIRASCATLPPA